MATSLDARARVALAQDDQLAGDTSKIFYQRLQGHPRLAAVHLEISASTSPPACTALPSNAGLGEHVNAPGPIIEWTDLFLIVLGTDTLAKMLHGITAGSFLLKILRSWDVSKKILLVLYMSKNEWDNPLTRKQLSKIRRKWKWIRVLDEPILYSGAEAVERALLSWSGMDEMLETVYNQADIFTLGYDVDTRQRSLAANVIYKRSPNITLPSEIWSMVLEYTRDWELAQALGIYTNLSLPLEWSRLIPNRRPGLEWTILKGRLTDFISRLPAEDPPRWLSGMCVKLIIKFARLDILEYLEANHKELFWSAFGHKLLPTKASAKFPQTEVLNWWKDSASFLTKEYTTEAMDLASKAGFIHVLDWWRGSSLPLRYTEAALEQAASTAVLEWWRVASKISLNDKAPLQLKVGKSLLVAAQNGQADFIKWWAQSGISTGHEDAVARTASTNGHVNVLQQWKVCKGDKMQFDNRTLFSDPLSPLS